MATIMTASEGVLRGTVYTSFENVKGSLRVPEQEEKYTGEYVVVPELEAQTLETANKLLSEDVIVTAIPYYEVSNTSDGETVVIGKSII